MSNSSAPSDISCIHEVGDRVRTKPGTRWCGQDYGNYDGIIGVVHDHRHIWPGDDGVTYEVLRHPEDGAPMFLGPEHLQLIPQPPCLCSTDRGNCPQHDGTTGWSALVAPSACGPT